MFLFSQQKPSKHNNSYPPPPYLPQRQCSYPKALKTCIKVVIWKFPTNIKPTKISALNLFHQREFASLMSARKLQQDSIAIKFVNKSWTNFSLNAPHPSAHHQPFNHNQIWVNPTKGKLSFSRWKFYYILWWRLNCAILPGIF